MDIVVVSLFPALVEELVQHGIPRKASAGNQLSLSVVNPRDFTDDVHRTVDDRPYGGGPGMVMKVEPLRAALAEARRQVPGAPVIYLSPQGQRYDQQQAETLARWPGMILLAGRYEGIDERVVDADIDMELSIGDYVLSGGEIAAMAVIDSVVRLLPNVLGHQESAVQDSFAGDGLLDCPHYTRPEVLDGVPVPPVLLSGDHARVHQWRHQQALVRTWQRRPDLLAGMQLNAADQDLIRELGQGAVQGAVQQQDAQRTARMAQALREDTQDNGGLSATGETTERTSFAAEAERRNDKS